MEWTSPDELRTEVQKSWNRGRILAARLTGEALFPMPLRTRRPSRRDLSDRFAEVRTWIRALEAESRERTGAGYEIVWEEIEHRQLGRNRVPRAVVVPTEGDALHLIAKSRATERFSALAAMTLAQLPALRPWVIKKPLILLEHADAWPQIVAAVSWLCAHPRPDLYVRQLDIPGVDTKFIEARRALLSELLDLALSPDAIDVAAPSFEERYGLRVKPVTVRLRILDPRQAIAGLTDVSAPVEQLAEHPPAARHVFITENEINGLVFPAVEDALVIFGLGYGVETLARLEWLRDRDIWYWGDIDTHGYAMLDRLRGYFPATRSMLMDRETLLSHRPQWVREASAYRGLCFRLHDAERSVFDDLVHDRLGERVRLEQERVSYAALSECLAQAMRG